MGFPKKRMPRAPFMQPKNEIMRNKKAKTHLMQKQKGGKSCNMVEKQIYVCVGCVCVRVCYGVHIYI